MTDVGLLQSLSEWIPVSMAARCAGLPVAVVAIKVDLFGKARMALVFDSHLTRAVEWDELSEVRVR